MLNLFQIVFNLNLEVNNLRFLFVYFRVSYRDNKQFIIDVFMLTDDGLIAFIKNGVD